MPLWGTGYPGSNPISPLNFVDLRAGDKLALFDGTEAIATGSKSIAFARGYVIGGNQGRTYNVTGCPGGSVFTLQCSDGLPTDSYGNPLIPETLASYDASFTSTGETVTGNLPFTDTGNASLYRVVCSTFVSGDAPVVIVKVG